MSIPSLGWERFTGPDTYGDRPRRERLGLCQAPCSRPRASPTARRRIPPAHATTTWIIRAVGGTYDAPVFRVTSTTHLTTLPIPFEEL